ncbi:MAG: carboxymuconolactone decarboxylase family protein [Candidatus Binataceae bacterium]
MSRIQMVEPKNASPEVRAVYEKFQADGFQIFNVMKMFGNNQYFVAGMYQMVAGIYTHAKLAPRYRELAYLRASQLNSCHY